jgi:hypothetical protein
MQLCVDHIECIVIRTAISIAELIFNYPLHIISTMQLLTQSTVLNYQP